MQDVKTLGNFELLTRAKIIAAQERQVEELLVRYSPRPTVTDGSRRQAHKETVPLIADAQSFGAESTQSSAPSSVPMSAPATPRRDELQPAATDVFNIRFAAKRAFVEKLERAQELLSHSVPDGSYEEILERALDVLLAKKDPMLKPETGAPKSTAMLASKARPESRYIPKSVEQTVVKRDGGQCVHVDLASGKRCSGRRFLHVDHVVPLARGGSSRDPANLRLLCATHNQLAARRIFGESWMERKVAEQRQRSSRVHV